ncbi:vitamin B12-transporter ATPase [Serratia ficaria]|uniref:AAA family ATPase n=1 Tax=Serratia ficaria TaxID=61651 RepID=UPI002183B9DB|nr:ATP-binding protein [Serratia ficaria]CAI2521664.1 vitamin B12-transporter ATPase [Serratia ficaria]
MIVGVFLRNYKVFRNQHYIPICLDGNSCYFIGENGVGKSTVLSAIDTLLNESDINKLDINNEIRSLGYETREPFIVSIFLIDKDKVKKNPAMSKALETISSITWQIEAEDFNSSQRVLADKFIEHRNMLASRYNEKTHYLVPIGFVKKRANEVPIPSMSIFESIDDYKEELVELSELYPNVPWLKKYKFEYVIAKVFSFIKELYNYIYIPAEITVHSYSKIEGELAQSLLGDDIQSKISKVIKKTDITAINKHLNEYIDSVSRLLNNSYHFKKPSQRQTQFTQRHMILKIIETYFSDKILHRKNDGKDTPINNLSSGEKRRALLDLATAFLKANPKRSQTQTIFAIDEPELSLHSSACFKQFEKISAISKLGIQTLVTTHWYGFLPTIGYGTAVYISPNQNFIKALDLRFYRDALSKLAEESRGSYIDTLEVKSNHDLVQSIISSITSGNKYNWLICEGKTDKKYLECHLQFENIDNLIVLPVGGSFVLKDIYSYLILALKDRRKTITGKVFCLLDTDEKYDRFESSDSIPEIKIRRLLLNRDRNRIDLLKTTDNTISPPTEIEDSLDGDFFMKTLMSLEEKGEDRFNFIYSVDVLESDISSLKLNFTSTQKKIIDDYFKEPGKKDVFCNEYCMVINEDELINTPRWMFEIADFFDPED